METKKHLTYKILEYLLANFEKVAMKQMISGETYVKIYSNLDKKDVLNAIQEKFEKSNVVFETYKQDPPFINDGINALELMIITDEDYIFRHFKMKLRHEKPLKSSDINYNIVTIGNQDWLKEHLRFEDVFIGKINLVQTTQDWAENNLKKQPTCFEITTNGDEHYFLFNGYALNEIQLSLKDGWRIPSISDFTKLNSVENEKFADFLLNSSYNGKSDDRGRLNGENHFHYLWTSEKRGENQLGCIVKKQDKQILYPKYLNFGFGLSVRLIRDN